MSGPQTFTPTPADMQRAQAYLDSLIQLYNRASANGGSCVPELHIPVATVEDQRAYAVLRHNGWGDFLQTHTGLQFKFRHRDANLTTGIQARDPVREALGQRSSFWEIFEKSRNQP